MICKRLTALLMLLILLCAGTAFGDGQVNLLANPSFEQLDDDGLPSGWYTDAYRTMTGYTLYKSTENAQDGERCVTIENIGMNDARFAQKVRVEPDTLYRLSGWIRADGIADSGHGANLSVADVYAFSRSVYESSGWEYVEYYGWTGPEQTELIVFARVGGYSGESIGSASFDNLMLTKVDTVPPGVVADRWYKIETASVQQNSAVAESSETASPFWPWLIVLAGAYLLLMTWLRPYLLDSTVLELHQGKTSFRLMIGGIAASTLLQLAISMMVEGYGVDVNCFLSWGATMLQVGPSGFYTTTSFCDYPPAYLYVLGASRFIGDRLYEVIGRPGLITAYKLVPIACNAACAAVVYRIACEEGANRRTAAALGVLTAWSVALILNSAARCQMDSVLCLLLLCVAWLAIRGKWAILMPVYVLAVLVKPQALMLGPLGLLAIINAWIRQPKLWKQLLAGLGMALALALIVIVPFSSGQEWSWIFSLYGRTLASYPYASLNTANLYYLSGGNWAAVGDPANWLAPALLATLGVSMAAYLYKRQKGMRLGLVEPVAMLVYAAAFTVLALTGASWGVIGTVAMSLCFVIVLSLYLRCGDVKKLPLLGGLLFLLLYVLGVKMHERYLMPALVLFAMAFALQRDRRILYLMAGITATLFINEGIVLDNSIRLGSSGGHLNQDTYGLNMLLSILNVVSVPYAIHMAYSLCIGETAEASEEDSAPAQPEKMPPRVKQYIADSSLHWRRLDWVLMISVTVIYAAVALCNLGSTKAPQNPWKSTTYDEQVVIDLGAEYENFRMLYFAQVSYDDFSVAVSSDGETWSHEYWAEMAQGQCFRWKYVTAYTMNGAERRYNTAQTVPFTGRYVRISAQQVGLILNEVIFRDAAGELIPATAIEQIGANESSPLYSDISALLDEQNTLDGEPSWYNSTYFDEIYHARTAFEHMNGTTPYETTHPPLGKVIMSWFVALFGMTPFGWRFAGALAGILMLPVMYLLGKQLTKRTDVAFAGMMMMTLDCMHFTQTRIATIDSFPVLFIMASYLFMLRFMQRDIVRDSMRKVLPDLALSGLFMGLGIASKWIGVYAGVGLAVLYFWTCLRHVRMGVEAAELLAHEDELADDEREVLKLRSNQALRRPLLLCCWCLLFFVAVPVMIYVLSYIPYFSYREFDSVIDFIKSIISAQQGMLNYHATPGLGMDHPFYSPWYEWPLNQRPMYYANAYYVPEGYDYAMFCFGNPAVWTGGLVGIAYVVYAWIKRHYYLREGSLQMMHVRAKDCTVALSFVLIGLLAQFLPWVLVPRGTYIYHYFASVPFLCLGVVLLLDRIRQKRPKLGLIILAAYVVLCLVLFVAFYPYASGVLTPNAWLDFMRRFLYIYH